MGYEQDRGVGLIYLFIYEGEELEMYPLRDEEPEELVEDWADAEVGTGLSL